MEIEFDPAKRAITLIHRGLDFARCTEVFAGPHLQLEDTRQDYGERRFIVFGFLDGREVVIVWTPRGDARRIISMRKANEREIRRFKEFLDRF